MNLESDHRPRRDGSGLPRKRVVLIVYAVWVALVLTATVPYMAEEATRRPVTFDSFEYRPTFSSDGDIKHYYVERANATDEAGLIIKYDAGDSSVDITATNIDKLTVDCDSIAQMHSQEILKEEFDGSLIDDYFADMGSIRVQTDVRESEGMEITWKNMPIPSAVVADREPYDGELPGGGQFTVDVPAGPHQYILYFGEQPEFPTARISVDHPVTLPGEEIFFDASASSGGEGADGKIRDYMWDLDTSDGNLLDSGDKSFTDVYDQPGIYNVSLTVRNGYHLLDTAYVDIEVITGEDERADMDGDGQPNWDDDDIDGDGFLNEDESRLTTDPTDADSTPPDLDNDLIPDADDPDLDNDGILNVDDYFPDDGTRWEQPAGEKDDEDPTGTYVVVAVVVVMIVITVVMLMVMGRMRAAARARAAAAERSRAPVHIPTPRDMRPMKDILPDIVDPGPDGEHKRPKLPKSAAAIAAGVDTGASEDEEVEDDMEIDEIDISDIWDDTEDDGAAGAPAPAPAPAAAGAGEKPKLKTSKQPEEVKGAPAPQVPAPAPAPTPPSKPAPSSSPVGKAKLKVKPK